MYRCRMILLDWIGCVFAKYHADALQPWFLTVHYIDRLLQQYHKIQVEVKGKRTTRHISHLKEELTMYSHLFHTTRLQLTGSACAGIANKLMCDYALNGKDWVYMADNAFTVVEYELVERQILSLLQYNLCVDLPLTTLWAHRHSPKWKITLLMLMGLYLLAENVNIQESLEIEKLSSYLTSQTLDSTSFEKKELIELHQLLTPLLPVVFKKETFKFNYSSKILKVIQLYKRKKF